MDSRLKVLTVRRVGSKPGRQHNQLASDLGDALDHQDIEVNFQLQYELRSGRACGLEALARWPRLDGEVTPPSMFIPVAERFGMIGAVGVSVLYQACRTVGEWTEIAPQLPTLSVNVSAQQLTEDFSAVIGSILELTEFPATRLELEVTETGLISNVGVAARTLEQCKKLGVRIALDDFGTGYSGLAYLARLPVDRLKLDQSFVQAMATDRKVAAIVRSVLAMGREMNLEVLAEGIESERQLEMLIGMGCCLGQGNLLAHTMPAEAARELLHRPWGIRHAGGLHAA
jgi:EAL domain-containing protein (putative c-di-GMP-specific phosphodiesterase class I)